MNLLDRLLRNIQRVLTFGPSGRVVEPEPVPAFPGARHQAGRARRMAAVAAAVILPVGFGAVLIPLRDQIGHSISLLMVLPVLVVALLAGRRLAIIAALAAALAYDVFHTQPYYRPSIDDSDDIVETIVLMAIGITIGYLAESAERAVVAARVRHNELTAVTDFLNRVGTSISDEEFGAHASDSIVQLLGARDCVWDPDYRGSASPVLRPDGSLGAGGDGYGADGGSLLPGTIEIPVGHPPTEYGRFIVRTNPRADVSLEERRAAATIALALARCIRR